MRFSHIAYREPVGEKIGYYLCQFSCLVKAIPYKPSAFQNYIEKLLPQQIHRFMIVASDPRTQMLRSLYHFTESMHLFE